MIDRVDEQLVFKPLNNRPFLHGETEPCINGRILGIGAYFKEPRRWRLELRGTPKPALFISHHHLRA
jgi:hypothetical protein